MARISTYNLDNTVSKNDRLIGTDSSGDATKNLRLEDLAGFLNTSSLINVNGQLVYLFKNANDPAVGQFTITGGGVPSLSSVTSFSFSHTNANNQNIQTYLNYFLDLRVMITQTDNQNNFGLFSIDNIVDSNSGYSNFTVTFIEGNGSMVTDKHYAMSFSPKGQTDKNFVSDLVSFNSDNNFSQQINHNLNKFPSVTVVDSGGSHVIGEVNHINKNSLTITFKSAFSAKVYVN